MGSGLLAEHLPLQEAGMLTRLVAWGFLKTKRTLKIKTQDRVSHISPFIHLPRSLNQHSVAPSCSLDCCAWLHLVPQSDPFKDGLLVILGGNECSSPAGVQVLAAQPLAEVPPRGDSDRMSLSPESL